MLNLSTKSGQYENFLEVHNYHDLCELADDVCAKPTVTNI